NLPTTRIRKHEALRLDRRQPSRGLATLLSDLLPQLQLSRLQLDVERDEERPRADDDGTGGVVQTARTHIRHVRGLEKPRKPLVFRLADVRKANPLGPGSGLRVVEDGDRVTLCHVAAGAMRQGDALVHRHAGEGNERNDVDRTEARML